MLAILRIKSSRKNKIQFSNGQTWIYLHVTSNSEQEHLLMANCLQKTSWIYKHTLKIKILELIFRNNEWTEMITRNNFITNIYITKLMHELKWMWLINYWFGFALIYIAWLVVFTLMFPINIVTRRRHWSTQWCWKLLLAIRLYFLGFQKCLSHQQR